MRAVRIVEALNQLVEDKTILGFTRMGNDRWLIQARDVQYYYTSDEAEAFTKGAAAARS